MARHETLTSLFTAIADAIRAKTGGTSTLKADDFDQAIAAIPSGKTEETFDVTPTTSDQTVSPSSAANVFSGGTVRAMPAGSATTPATTKQQSQPSITVSAAGLVTASVAQDTVSITPTVVAGYVGSGTAGTVTLASNQNTLQLTTESEKTVVPTTSAQTAVAAGKYTTGAVTVAGDANLVAEKILKNVTIFGVTGTVEPQPTTGSVDITPNGSTQVVDVADVATAYVLPIYESVATVAELEAKLTEANVGKMYKYTGPTTQGYVQNRLYVVRNVA